MRHLTKIVDVSKITKRGTALHVACKAGQVKSVRFLLAKANISTELKDSDNKVAAEVATEQVKQFLTQNDILLKLLNSNTKNEKASLVEESPEKPQMVRGNVQLHIFAFVTRDRILEINPDLCSLIFYEQEKHIPKKPKDIIPIKDISHIEEWKGTKMMSSSLSYIRILYGADQIVIGLHFSSSRQLWLHHLKVSMDYCKFVERKILNYFNLHEQKKLNRSFLYLSILEGEQPMIKLEDKQRVTDTLGKGNKSNKSSMVLSQSETQKKQRSFSSHKKDKISTNNNLFENDCYLEQSQIQSPEKYLSNLEFSQKSEKQSNFTSENLHSPPKSKARSSRIESNTPSNLQSPLKVQPRSSRIESNQSNASSQKYFSDYRNTLDKQEHLNQQNSSLQSRNSSKIQSNSSISHHPSNPFIYNQDSSCNLQERHQSIENIVVWHQLSKQIILNNDRFAQPSNKQLIKPQKPPSSLKQFNILDILGSGSFGRVFLAQEKGKQGLDSLYALKSLKKHTIMAKNQLKYAKRELSILKRCSFPFIVHLRSSFQSLNYMFFALEYCTGGDLGRILAVKNGMKEETARFLSSQIVLALEYLHSLGIVYRDMKPENILLNSDGYIKITDFGLSRDNVKEGEQLRSFCGSPAYISPEILRGEGASVKTDVYGLGCVLYEMITGNPPFMSQEINSLYHLIKNAPVDFRSEKFSPAAKNLLEGMLAKTKEARIGLKAVKEHEFFKQIDWKKLEKKQLHPNEEIMQCMESEMSESFFQSSSEQIFKDIELDESKDPGKLKIDNWSFCGSYE